MWRRAYLLLTLLRLYFALCPSYLHPDENFQGPEVIAGHVFGYPVHKTWEFTSEQPIRSSFPLWISYGFPMTVLKWIWEGLHYGQVRPSVVFWTLRLMMFALSFVLEDWAIHDLIDNPRQRQQAMLLVASSYVTWTWQSHTFSNSCETLVVLWSLVLIQRLREHHKAERSRLPQRRLRAYSIQVTRPSLYNPAILAILLVYGTFNRITFPAFVFIPFLSVIPAILERQGYIIVFTISAIATGLLAVLSDTEFYANPAPSFLEALRDPIITPLNNLRYNSQAKNLKQHGVHPFYQHYLVNLPQLLGPVLLIFCVQSVPRRRFWSNLTLSAQAALSGTTILSLISHQEARFLMPAVPLILSTIELPTKRNFFRMFTAVWIIFNLIFGLLMGIYHQAGVYPAQIWIEAQTPDVIPTNANVFWWKTYSPPTWLLDGRNNELSTIDLMGLPQDQLQTRVCDKAIEGPRMLVAPRSAAYLDQFLPASAHLEGSSDRMLLEQELWSIRTHLNLDDLDFGDDGIWPTFKRVLGRRGLVIWNVTC
ncbi:MAG: hypothetical protein Q9162_003257 [Coniocarpon cinnabarinum]